MKKRKLAGYSIALLALFFALNPSSAQAAACADVSEYGAVDMAIPALPNADTHALWIRLQSTQSTARVLAEVNGLDCLEISGTNMPPNLWSWQTYRQNGTISPLKFPRKEGNNIIIIGVEAGVKVDRVLVTRSDCVPQDFGDNCSDSAEAISATSDKTILSIPPPSKYAISGKVSISSTPGIYQAQLEELSYTIQGRVLQSSNQNKPFDTTLLTNGKHTIIITTKLSNGAVIKEQTVVDVDNPENAFTPAIRWVRLHMGSVKTIGMVIGAILITIFLYSLLRRWYLGYRQRKFHGL